VESSKNTVTQYRLIRGHFGSVCLWRTSDGHHAWFADGRRTLTGSKNRNGELRCFTARELVRFLLGPTVRLPARPRSYRTVHDIKGIFDPVSWHDAGPCLKRCHGSVPLPMYTLCMLTDYR